MKLLNEVGEKLYIMDLQSKDDTDYETFAQGITKKVSIDEIDPLEKVAKWRKDLNKPSNVPSGYGSNSTSPTPMVGCKKIVSSERSSFEERSPGILNFLIIFETGYFLCRLFLNTLFYVISSNGTCFQFHLT